MDLESRVRPDHPLRAIRDVVNAALAAMSPDFEALYSRLGRPGIVPCRTTRHPGYAVSLRVRKRIEEGFGWVKKIAGLAQVKLRGLARVDCAFVLSLAACNLVRLPKLLTGASP